MHIFYCVGGKFGEVVGVQDAGRGGTGRRAYASGVLSCLARLGLSTGCRITPVYVSGAAYLLRVSLAESTGCSGHVW